MSNLDQYSRKPSGASGKRFVPPTTALAVLFGGFLVQFGAGFFAFGMIFWWVFGAQADVTSWYQFAGSLAKAPGTVTALEATGISEGGDDDTPGTPVYQISYEFKVGATGHAGTCYATGYNPPPGVAVEIEHDAKNPTISRIVGTRKKPIAAWALFVAVFPGIGLLMMFFGLRANARALRLLRIGKQARGRLVNKETTNTKINNQMVYKLTFEYTDDAGQTHRMSDKTHHTHLVEDEETERLFYDPKHPSEGKLVDLLPGRPRVDADGSIGWVNPVVTLIRVVLPVGGIAAHVAVGLLVYVL